MERIVADYLSGLELGTLQSFNGKLTDELLDRQVLQHELKPVYYLKIDRRSIIRYTLNYRPPAPEAIIPVTLTQQVVQLMGAGPFASGNIEVGGD